MELDAVDLHLVFNVIFKLGIFLNLYLFLQRWTNADRILFNVVDDGTVGDIVIISSLFLPQEQEKHQDENQGYEGRSTDESKNCGDMALI